MTNDDQQWLSWRHFLKTNDDNITFGAFCGSSLEGGQPVGLLCYGAWNKWRTVVTCDHWHCGIWFYPSKPFSGLVWLSSRVLNVKCRLGSLRESREREGVRSQCISLLLLDIRQHCSQYCLTILLTILLDNTAWQYYMIILLGNISRQYCFTTWQYCSTILLGNAGWQYCLQYFCSVYFMASISIHGG